MKYLRVPNLKSFQHYSDRNPAWIKLHRSIMENYEFSQLKDAHKYQLIAIWLLATQCKNLIPHDEKWLAKKINATEKIPLDIFTENNMLEICLRDGSKSPTSVTERREEKSIEEKNIYVVPYEEIVKTYHEKLPSLPKVVKLTPSRRVLIKQRWIDDMPSIDRWHNFFDYVGQSDFLMGKVASKDRKPFRASLEWLCKLSNFVKVSEGNYHV